MGGCRKLALVMYQVTILRTHPHKGDLMSAYKLVLSLQLLVFMTSTYVCLRGAMHQTNNLRGTTCEWRVRQDSEAQWLVSRTWNKGACSCCLCWFGRHCQDSSVRVENAFVHALRGILFSQRREHVAQSQGRTPTSQHPNMPSSTIPYFKK